MIDSTSSPWASPNIPEILNPSSSYYSTILYVMKFIFWRRIYASDRNSYKTKPKLGCISQPCSEISLFSCSRITHFIRNLSITQKGTPRGRHNQLHDKHSLVIWFCDNCIEITRHNQLHDKHSLVIWFCDNCIEITMTIQTLTRRTARRGSSISFELGQFHPTRIWQYYKDAQLTGTSSRIIARV